MLQVRWKDVILEPSVIVMFLLQILDITTTIQAFSQGGKELNPLMATMFAHLPSAWVMVCSKAVLFPALMIIWQYKRLKQGEICGFMPSFAIKLAAVQGLIVANNLIVCALTR